MRVVLRRDGTEIVLTAKEFELSALDAAALRLELVAIARGLMELKGVAHGERPIRRVAGVVDRCPRLGGEVLLELCQFVSQLTGQTFADEREVLSDQGDFLAP